MAKVVTTIPQMLEPAVHLHLRELLASLPETLDHKFNIGITGRIRLGRQSGAVHFVAATDDEVSSEIKQEFSEYVRAASGDRFGGTISNAWRVRELNPLWVYSGGSKVLKFDGDNLISTKPQSPIELPEWLPVNLILERIRNLKWEFPFDCHFTGGMVREGGSFNDADFIVGDVQENASGDAEIRMTVPSDVCRNVRAYLQDAIRANVGVNEILILRSLTVDVGSTLMQNKGPVYTCKVFDGHTRLWCGPDA